MIRTRALLLGWLLVTLALPAQAFAVTTAEGSDASGMAGTPMLDKTTKRVKCEQATRGPTVKLPGSTETAWNACASVTTTYSDYCGNVANGIPCLDSATKISTAVIPDLSGLMPPPFTIQTSTVTSTYTWTVTASISGTTTATHTGSGSVTVTGTNTNTITRTGTWINTYTAISTATELTVGVGDSAPNAQLALRPLSPFSPALKLRGDITGLAPIQTWRDYNNNLLGQFDGNGELVIGAPGITQVGRLSAGYLLLGGGGTYVQFGNGQNLGENGFGGLDINAGNAMALNGTSVTVNAPTTVNGALTINNTAVARNTIICGAGLICSGITATGTGTGTATGTGTFRHIHSTPLTIATTDTRTNTLSSSATGTAASGYAAIFDGSAGLRTGVIRDDGIRAAVGQAPNTTDKLSVSTAAADNYLGAELYSTTNGHSNYWISRRSNSNTPGTKTTTVDGQYFGTMYFYGVTGAGNWASGALIQAAQSGVAGTNFLPTKLILATSSATALNANQFVLDSDGTGTFANRLTVGSLSTAGIVTLAPSGGGTGYLMLKTGSTNRGIIGFGGSVDGATDANIDIYSYTGEVQLWSAGTKAAWADTSANFQLAKALKLNGSTSGTATITVPAAAGTTTWKYPAANCSTSQSLNFSDGSGTMACYTPMVADGTTGTGCTTVNTSAGKVTSCDTTARLAGNGYTVSSAKLVDGATNGQITSARAMTSGDVTGALGYTPVPPSRTVCGNALSSNVTCTASDVGADASGTATTAVNAAVNGTAGYVPYFSSAHVLGNAYPAGSTPGAYTIAVGDSGGTLNSWVTKPILIGSTSTNDVTATTGTWQGLVPAVLATLSSNAVITATASGSVTGITQCAIAIAVDGSIPSHGTAITNTSGSGSWWNLSVTLTVPLSSGSHSFEVYLSEPAGNGETCKVLTATDPTFYNANLTVVGR